MWYRIVSDSSLCLVFIVACSGTGMAGAGCYSRVAGVRVSYSGGPGFKFRAGDQLWFRL